MRLLKPMQTKRANPDIKVCSRSIEVDDSPECIITFTPSVSSFTVKEAKRLILELEQHIKRIEKFRGVR